jgi:hypothetical protein
MLVTLFAPLLNIKVLCNTNILPPFENAKNFFCGQDSVLVISEDPDRVSRTAGATAVALAHALREYHIIVDLLRLILLLFTDDGMRFSMKSRTRSPIVDVE